MSPFTPNVSPAQRAAFGKEEQRSERMMNFLEPKTRRKRYEACDELPCVSEKDALPADHVPPNRRPVGRISGKTGLLAGGAYAP